MEKSEIDRINKWFNSKPKWFLYGVDRFVEEVYSGTSISWGVVVGKYLTFHFYIIIFICNKN